MIPLKLQKLWDHNTTNRLINYKPTEIIRIYKNQK